MPKISVIIPVFNAEKFILETLESIINQSYVDYECILINDGSTDDTISIIDDFIKIDKRFKCVTIENSGCADIPIKYGISISKGEFFVIIGHDDYLSNDYLLKAYEKQIETQSDIVISKFIGSKNQLEGDLYMLPLNNREHEIISGRNACKQTIGGWKISCNGMLCRRSLYYDIPEGKFMNSDELSSRYLLITAKIVSFSNGEYRYRNNVESI